MYGVSSMTDSLRRVALRRPAEALLSADATLWHYGPSFDPQRVGDEHASLAELLETVGVEIVWMDGDDNGLADAVFTYDASLMTPKGAILMSPGKMMRAGELRPSPLSKANRVRVPVGFLMIVRLTTDPA